MWASLWIASTTLYNCNLLRCSSWGPSSNSVISLSTALAFTCESLLPPFAIWLSSSPFTWSPDFVIISHLLLTTTSLKLCFPLPSYSPQILKLKSPPCFPSLQSGTVIHHPRLRPRIPQFTYTPLQLRYLRPARSNQ